MDRPTTVVVLTVLAVLGVAVGACSGPAAQTCISWVGYEDDAARTEAADVVVEGVVREQVGQRAMFGTRATVWGVEVTTALKGGVTAGERLDVASTPRTCEGGSVYPDGDPLDTDGSLRLYLVDSDFAIEGTETGLALITPFDGTAPVGSTAPSGSSSRET